MTFQSFATASCLPSESNSPTNVKPVTMSTAKKARLMACINCNEKEAPEDCGGPGDGDACIKCEELEEECKGMSESRTSGLSIVLTFRTQASPSSSPRSSKTLVKVFKSPQSSPNPMDVHL